MTSTSHTHLLCNGLPYSVFNTFIDVTMILYLNSKLDLNLSSTKDLRNLNIW